ncbi:MAG: M15 family metallopeptidase [Nocardioides sp.]|uniref:M15 family metallopeptidase n=1 Tax=Nocardioides sp. TaxID=35761 RepID=UPI0039E587E4
MTEHSYNGWPASPTLATRVITPVSGVSFRVADNQNVEDIFTFLAQWYDTHVEALKGSVADDWGFAYRANRNDPDELSNHASGSALDFNATKHPNGVAISSTFTAAQIRKCDALEDCLEVVAWGGNYVHTVDGMHWEIAVEPGGLQDVGARIRQKKIGPVIWIPDDGKPVDLSNMKSQFRRAAGAEKGKVTRHNGVGVIQTYLNKRYSAGLTVDGLVGAKTLNAWGRHEAKVGGQGRPRIPDRKSLAALAKGRFEVKS